MDREPGERIIFRDHPCFRATPGRHARTVLLAVAAGVLAGLAETVSAGRAESAWVAPVVAAVLLARFGLAALRRHATVYTVTDRQVACERGLVRRRSTVSPLANVLGATCRQGVRERMLKTGTVWVRTTDGHLAFRHVGEPDALARRIEALIDPGPLDPRRRDGPASDRRERYLAVGNY
jgi:membrane protein YdbS with pleckstrin-like domain